MVLLSVCGVNVGEYVCRFTYCQFIVREHTMCS